MSGSDLPVTSGTVGSDYFPTVGTKAARWFGWTVVAAAFAFVINSYLTFHLDWPGFETLMGDLGPSGQATPNTMLSGGDLALGWIQAALYAVCAIGPLIYVSKTVNRSLRQDSMALHAMANYIIRAAFWMVVLIGTVDAIISFLRVEGILDAVVGTDLATDLGRSVFRGTYVHIPLVGVAIIIAAFTRSLSFAWLALLVVGAELSIVISRFIFSYEQAFQGDLVRFWYAALFLFSSSYTLFDDGHVRVDILYSGFTEKTKGAINAVGSVLLGFGICWVILVIGFGGKSSIIIAPLMNFEVSQSGFGLYVKYMMAGFLSIFAITMMIQFASYFLEGIADYRDDPGHRTPGPEPAH